ncbi:MAG: universal stress protein [Deltaproteobacteria bacterium]|nr:MAG: universal stress protein [Deltaproteobacteria bacterium]RLB79624.1 MAG: universal stress protein [Deltaproteobacteria bacterium]
MKILWPNDLSKCSEGAIPYVKSFAQHYDAEVHVLYVMEDLARHESWYGDFERSTIEKLRKWEEKKARERQEQLCQKYFEDCKKFEKHIRVGDPAQEILKFIESEKVDAVVMCRKGEAGMFKMGSVAERVVRNAPVPVVTVPSMNGSK